METNTLFWKLPEKRGSLSLWERERERGLSARTTLPLFPLPRGGGDVKRRAQYFAMLPERPRIISNNGLLRF